MAKKLRYILGSLLAFILIAVIPLLFYNSLVDPDAFGSSIIFLIIPVIITILVGIFILYKTFKK